MAGKKPANSGRPWTPRTVKEVRDLARGNTPTRLIALKTGRTPEAIQSIASRKNISLKPTNQRPYGESKR